MPQSNLHSLPDCSAWINVRASVDSVWKVTAISDDIIQQVRSVVRGPLTRPMFSPQVLYGGCRHLTCSSGCLCGAGWYVTGLFTGGLTCCGCTVVHCCLLGSATCGAVSDFTTLTNLGLVAKRPAALSSLHIYRHSAQPFFKTFSALKHAGRH